VNPPASPCPAPTWRLRQAARVLARGGILAYPTEAVFGLGCDPGDAWAVERLLALKRRPVEKGLILIAADYVQLIPYVRPLPEPRMGEILASWPGPSTWLLPAAPDTPYWLTGNHDTLAVRVTAHPLAQALCRVWGGPLVSTSANPAGAPPARSPLQVRRYFGDRLELVLTGRLGASRRPTSIRDGRSGHLLRA
jgi:L-threonylcarbamoyladenylate synthase